MTQGSHLEHWSLVSTCLAATGLRAAVKKDGSERQLPLHSAHSRLDTLSRLESAPFLPPIPRFVATPTPRQQNHPCCPIPDNRQNHQAIDLKRFFRWHEIR